MKQRIAICALALCALALLCAAHAAAYTPGTIYVSKDGGTLNLRAGESVGSASLGIIKHDENILILETGGEWSKIFVYRLDIEGYVKTKYIVKDKAEFVNAPVKPSYAESAQLHGTGTFTADLDGDGTEEQVLLETVYNDVYTMATKLTVITQSGARYTLDSAIESDPSIVFAYLDAEAKRMYMFLSGDECSNDYITHSVYIDSNGLHSVPFAHPSPLTSGEVSHGIVTGVKYGEIELTATIDILGTRFMSRMYTLSNGALRYVPDGVWRANAALADPEYWEYASIKLKTDIPATLYGVRGTLPAGVRLVVTAIDDDARRAYFATDSGELGCIEYDMDTEYWGVRIGGVHEEDLFEELHYAG